MFIGMVSINKVTHQMKYRQFQIYVQRERERIFFQSTKILSYPTVPALSTESETNLCVIFSHFSLL